MRDRIDRDAVVAFARELVRIPSTNEPELGRSEARAAALVAERMREWGWRPLVEEVAPGRPNVVAVVEGGAPGPTLCFEGHTDVVTAGDPTEWERAPFGGEIADGRLYGRGAADMKGGLAAMLHAARALHRTRPFAGRLVVAALADEEGMMLGAKAFVARGHASGIDAAVICEPEAGEVCIAQKGAIRLCLTAVGRMAHGAMPEHGRNVVPALTAYAAALARLQVELHERIPVHPSLGRPYLTPTMLRAGRTEQLNVIPGRGWLGVDVRTVPGVDHGALLERLRALASEIGAAEGVELALEVIDDRPPTEVSPTAPVVEAIASAHRVVTGDEPVLGGVPGTTDGTILWRDAGIPVVVYGPGGKWIAHQANEFVELDEIARCAEVYLEAARRFLSTATPSSQLDRPSATPASA